MMLRLGLIVLVFWAGFSTGVRLEYRTCQVLEHTPVRCRY